MAGQRVEDGNAPLLARYLPKVSDDDDEVEAEGHARIKTGNLWTAIAHVITAVIGAGVLSLAWSIANLGWVAGPAVMVAFAAITLTQSSLIADCYRSPDPEYGRITNHSFMQAVNFYLGVRSGWICGTIQQLSLYGCGLAYTLATASSMRAILKSDCYHREGHNAPCSFSDGTFVVLFGLVQVVLSQVPDFHHITWLSIIAAIMSFCYSSIGLGLGVAKVIENGTIKGRIGGIPAASTIQKVWAVSQALGDIAFAYPYSIVLIEIEDTLKTPPPENRTMKKASAISIFITTFFYLCCGCFGYAAFGSDTPGNLLTGFGFYEPYWLVDLANACVVVHLIGGYQLYTQPVFSFADRWFREKFPNSGFVNKFHTIQLPLLPPCRLNPLRLCFRTLYVASTTGLAMFFPYFNQVLGLLGSFYFWPIAIYFPVEMYIVQKNIGAWTQQWVLLQMFSVVCLLVSMFALIGSVEGLISDKLG